MPASSGALAATRKAFSEAQSSADAAVIEDGRYEAALAKLDHQAADTLEVVRAEQRTKLVTAAEKKLVELFAVLMNASELNDQLWFLGLLSDRESLGRLGAAQFRWPEFVRPGQHDPNWGRFAAWEQQLRDLGVLK